MSINLNPYLGFRDNARQAMEFYRSVFGGELSIGTFAELGGSQDPGEADKVMHAQLEAPHGVVLMAADTPASMPYNHGDNIAVSLSGDDEATLRGYWEQLSDSGQTIEPLTTAPWGDSFGMCTDRFGITWMVNIAAAAA